MSKLLEQINKSERKEGTLGSFIELIGGGTPKTTVPEYWNGDIPWLSVADFNDDNRWVSDAEKKITDIGVKESSTKMLNKGDIIISARGTVGALAQLSRPMAFNQSCYGIRSKEGVDQEYLYYLLKASIPKLAGIVHGAVFDTITKDSFEHVAVTVPDTKTQKKVAEILSAYDTKIQNNNKIIKNLEETAQILFNEWFVKFRFPGYEKGKMVDSEMGEIPEGWEVKSLSEIMELAYGKALTFENRVDGEYPVLGSSGIVGFNSVAQVKGPGIVVGRKGNAGNIIWVDNDFCPIDTTFYVKSELPMIYCYFLLKQLKFSNSDSAVPGLGREDAYRNLIKIADKNLIKHFNIHIKVFFEIISTTKKENISLKLQRDQLLIKLI